ncbi:MAG: hypothetical protein K2M63_01120 [Muribaculaceae bacterium]|nr:hypothetical protein [Muribaculaceae bacterium]
MILVSDRVMHVSDRMMYVGDRMMHVSARVIHVSDHKTQKTFMIHIKLSSDDF